MNDRTAPCPNCGNDYGPTQMRRRNDGTWWCPGCGMEFGKAKK